MTLASEPTAETEHVRALERGIAVLLAFDGSTPAMTLAEVARRTDLNRATARRLLTTLQSLGFVRTDGRLFSLTPRVLDIGYSYLSAAQLPELATPHLDALSARLGESSSVAVLDGTDIVYVARAAARRIMSVQITVGTRFPAYATSMGRVLLAGLPDDERRSHLGSPTALTPKTVVDEDRLIRIVDQAGEQGFALVDEELEIGLRSIAAPIRHGERVVAAVNVSLSSAQWSVDDAIGRVLPALLNTASAIRDDLASVRRE